MLHFCKKKIINFVEIKTLGLGVRTFRVQKHTKSKIQKKKCLWATLLVSMCHFEQTWRKSRGRLCLNIVINMFEHCKLRSQLNIE